MKRLLGPSAALLLLLLLGLAKLKIVHDQAQMTLQQEDLVPQPPPPRLPSGLDGRPLNANLQRARAMPNQPHVRP